MNIEAIAIVVTVILALLSYLITYWMNYAQHRRSAQLDLINKRIAGFYGPLFISSHTSKVAFESFGKKVSRKDRPFDKKKLFAPGEPQPTENELAEWRLWMKNVLMPINEHIETIIVENAYLIQEKEIPPCVLQFITHVSGYRALLHKWDEGDFSDYVSIIPYPEELDEYAMRSYNDLKAKQLKLIGNSKLVTSE